MSIDAPSEMISVGSCPCCGALAQCIATDDPDGVPGKRFRRVPHSVDVHQFQDDIRDILQALGLGTHARPISPHEVVQREIIPTIRRLRVDKFGGREQWTGAQLLDVVANPINAEDHDRAREELLRRLNDTGVENAGHG